MAITGFQKSLLGFDPYEVQRENIKQMFAPINQARTSEGKIGAALGTLGGMALFGVPQDPRLKFAAEVKRVVDGVMGENPSAQDLATKLPELKEAFVKNNMLEQALVIEEKIKKLAPDSPFGKIDPSKYTPESIKEFVKAGAKPENISLLETVDGVVKPTPTFQQTAAGLGITVKNNLKSYTTDEVRKVNDAIKQQDLDKAKASAANVVAKVNLDTPEARMRAISEVNSNLKPYAESTVNTIQGIQLGMMSDSAFSQKAFESSVGNVFGNKVRAQAEIERLRNSGNLGERLTNTLSLFLTGKIGEATKDDQMEVLLALYEQNIKQYDLMAQPYRSAAGDITKADQVAPLAATRFSLPSLPPGKQYIPMSAVIANELKKGDEFEYKGEVYKYNGDGTYSEVKGK